MRIALSNLALPPINHLHLLPKVAETGATGLEIAPANTWPDTWKELGAAAVDFYGRVARCAGLEIVGLHALFDGHPSLGLFNGADAQTIDFIVHLSQVCRDLGGKTLVFGPRWLAGGSERRDAWLSCRSLLEKLLPRIEAHGTKLCFDPLSPGEGDFCITARECRTMVYALDDHPAMGIHLSSAALVANGETGHATFHAVSGRLDHFHADEPGLARFGTSGTIDHLDLSHHLVAIGYRDRVTLVQRPSPDTDPMSGIGQAVRLAADIYDRSLPVMGRAKVDSSTISRT